MAAFWAGEVFSVLRGKVFLHICAKPQDVELWRLGEDENKAKIGAGANFTGECEKVFHFFGETSCYQAKALIASC